MEANNNTEDRSLLAFVILNESVFLNEWHPGK